VETGWITRLLEALSELAFGDLIDVRSPVISQGAGACEAMPRQDDRVSIVRQHVFNLFVERPPRDVHSLTGEFIQPLFAHVGARDPPAARYVEREIVGARPQISVDITAAERRIGFSNRGLKWVRHARQFIKSPIVEDGDKTEFVREPAGCSTACSG
jgi:hypothetical protein